MIEHDETPKPAGKYITVEAAARIISFSPSYLNQLRVHGGGPPYYAFENPAKGGRPAIRYKEKEVEEWADSKRKTSTSAA